MASRPPVARGASAALGGVGERPSRGLGVALGAFARSVFRGSIVAAGAGRPIYRMGERPLIVLRVAGRALALAVFGGRLVTRCTRGNGGGMREHEALAGGVAGRAAGRLLGRTLVSRRVARLAPGACHVVALRAANGLVTRDVRGPVAYRRHTAALVRCRLAFVQDAGPLQRGFSDPVSRGGVAVDAPAFLGM